MAACAPGPAGDPATLDPSSTEAGPTSTSSQPTPDPSSPTTRAPTPGPTSPEWLGTRPLPPRPDGFGEVQDTPPELRDRRLPTVDHLPPPAGAEFTASVGPVPAAVVQRSTWSPACPVGLDDLRYVTVDFWGFDGRPHTGELLVNASAADGLVQVFRRLHQSRFPIEEMRVVRAEELDLPPTGDGNNTTAFVCRPITGGSSWSQHASGLAVDVNPFHNPYLRGDLVVPELASAYADRDDRRPGMVRPGDVVTGSFATLGWGWGGAWSTTKDYMHFSATGR